MGAPNPAPNEIDPRIFEKIKPGSGAVEIDIMDYERGAENLRPLLIMSPIDFPFPPSVEFCELMKRHGFRVIFIRRLGFGSTPALPRQLLTESNIKLGAAMMTEVAVIARVIDEMNLEDVTLLGIGSANSICYRLSQISPRISFSVFSQPIFNQDTFETLRPTWVQPIARQIILSQGGFKLAAKGLRFKVKRNALAFYDELYSKSSADLKYRTDNEEDFVAAGKFVLNIAAETLYYEMIHTLAADAFLKDGRFSDVHASVLVGSETTAEWRAGVKSEAERLGLPIKIAPRGGILCAYAAPDTLLELITKGAEQRSKLTAK